MIKLMDTTENEVEILSVILKDKNARIESIKLLNEKYFSNDLTRRLFKTIEYMDRKQKEIDLTLIIQEMEKLKLKQDGDITKISSIYSSYSIGETLEQHIEKLVEGYKSNEFKKKMYNFISANEILDTDGVINELSRILEDKNEDSPNMELLQEWLLEEVAEKMKTTTPKPLGLLTGYRGLDSILKGIVPGSLVTILARSGVGKTTFATELTKKISNKGNSITYFSLEMSPEQLYLKMVLAESGLTIDEYVNITKNSVNEVEKIAKGSSKVSGLNINFSQERNIDKIINLINYYVRKKKTNIFIIDYLNIVSSNMKFNNTDVLYNEITAQLKQIALKTKSIIFLITQSNRAVDTQQDKRPNLKDIKSSSSIEQNSDYIIALYRNLDFNNPIKRNKLHEKGKIKYNIPNADVNPECFETIILKNRHTGKCGTIYFKYLPNRGYMDWWN